MNKPLHTILGASGSVGRAIIDELKTRDVKIRAVARKMAFEGIENQSANLLNPEEAFDVIKGSAVVYLTVGLEYNISVWRTDWPILMKNVIDACEAENAVLIFLDNIYMYGPAPLQIPFDETHPQDPPSQKGQVRKQIAQMLQTEFDEKRLRGAIARAADFFGAHTQNSIFYFSFLERMLKGKSPQSVFSNEYKHTYANTYDVGRAMVELAYDETTYGQVWHTPVGEPIYVDDICRMMNSELGTQFKVSYIPKPIKKLMSFLMPIMKEVYEMNYQYESDYVMADQKFRSHFPDFKVTPYQDGIKAMVESFKEPQRN